MWDEEKLSLKVTKGSKRRMLLKQKSRHLLHHITGSVTKQLARERWVPAPAGGLLFARHSVADRLSSPHTDWCSKHKQTPVYTLDASFGESGHHHLRAQPALLHTCGSRTSSGIGWGGAAQLMYEPCGAFLPFHRCHGRRSWASKPWMSSRRAQMPLPTLSEQPMVMMTMAPTRTTRRLHGASDVPQRPRREQGRGAKGVLAKPRAGRSVIEDLTSHLPAVVLVLAQGLGLEQAQGLGLELNSRASHVDSDTADTTTVQTHHDGSTRAGCNRGTCAVPCTARSM